MLVPPAVVTTTRDAPAGFTGVVTKTDIGLLEIIIAAVLLNIIEDGLARLVLVIIIIHTVNYKFPEINYNYAISLTIKYP